MIATELGELRSAEIGWAERNGVEDARNVIHYRVSPDGRLVMGGRPVGLSCGTDLACDSDGLPAVTSRTSAPYPSVSCAR